MTEEFSFDVNEEGIKQLKSVIDEETIKIHKRFDNGTETLEDLLYQYPHIVLKCVLKNKKEVDLDVVERKYYERLAGRAKLQDTEINKLNNIIKWKPIEKYDRQKYDWVLVKYFDGDYECVPEVAEQRIDGKWYTNERQIPFEVKYFFDMQILDEVNNKETAGNLYIKSSYETLQDKIERLSKENYEKDTEINKLRICNENCFTEIKST